MGSGAAGVKKHYDYFIIKATGPKPWILMSGMIAWQTFASKRRAKRYIAMVTR
jgi:hypothetical protein